MVNLVLASTGHFAHGPYAGYASGLAVMDWLVVALKAIGAAVALLSIASRPGFVSPAVVTVLVWAGFATLGVYSLGSVVEAVGMASGLTGTAGQIDLAGVGCVLFFLLLAAGYGVLAISYSRRQRLRKRFVVLGVLGVLGAPVVLGLVLLAAPKLLTAAGLLPSS